MRTTFLAVVVLLGVTLFCFGVTPAVPGDTVAISKQFLPTLEATPSFDGWEDHMNELIYLVSIDDVDARRVTRKLIPFVNQGGNHYEELDFLGYEVYDKDQLKGVEKLPPLDQARTIAFYDDIKGLDWDEIRAAYLKDHADVKKIVESPDFSAYTTDGRVYVPPATGGKDQPRPRANPQTEK
jgi:hypothetical protein